MRILGLLLLLAITATTSAASAADVKHFGGRSSQNLPVNITTMPSGKPVRANIEWRARCDDGVTWRDGTKFWPPFDLGTPGAIKDAGPYKRSLDGYKGTIRVTFAGLQTARTRWQGSLRIRITATRNGRQVTCRSGLISWRARLR